MCRNKHPSIRGLKSCSLETSLAFNISFNFACQKLFPHFTSQTQTHANTHARVRISCSNVFIHLHVRHVFDFACSYLGAFCYLIPCVYYKHVYLYIYVHTDIHSYGYLFISTWMPLLIDTCLYQRGYL